MGFASRRVILRVSRSGWASLCRGWMLKMVTGKNRCQTRFFCLWRVSIAHSLHHFPSFMCRILTSCRHSCFVLKIGHGCQYKEAASAVPLESDGMDEGFWSSSIRVERSLTHTSEYHFGVLLDDDINALVCRIIHSLPRTQLVMVIDCCQ